MNFYQILTISLLTFASIANANVPISALMSLSCNDALLRHSKTINENSFIRNRTLEEYSEVFITEKSDLEGDLSSLGNDDVWLDIGAGNGWARQDYRGSGFVLQIGIKRPIEAVAHGHNFVYLERSLRDLRLTDVPEGKIIRIVTDIYGGLMAYGVDIRAGLEHLLNMLPVGSKIYSYFSPYRHLIFKGPEISEDFFKSLELRPISKSGGVLLDQYPDQIEQIDPWLNEIKGVRYDYLRESGFIMVKTHEKVLLPPLKVVYITHFLDSAVPIVFYVH